MNPSERITQFKEHIAQNRFGSVIERNDPVELEEKGRMHQVNSWIYTGATALSVISTMETEGADQKTIIALGSFSALGMLRHAFRERTYLHMCGVRLNETTDDYLHARQRHIESMAHAKEAKRQYKEYRQARKDRHKVR